MSHTAIIAIIVLIYLILLFGICGYAMKRQKMLEAEGKQGSFSMGAKSLGLSAVIFLVVGNMIGGTNTTGVAQLVFNGAGMSGVWYGIAGAIGAIFLGVVGAKQLRKYKYNTTSSLVGDCCGTGSRCIMSIGQLIIIQGVCCLQYVAGGALLSSMFPGIISYNLGIFISAIAFLVICLLGGLLGASISNLVNCMVIYVGLFLTTVIALFNIGGWGELTTQVEAISEPTTNGGSWLSLTGGLGIAVILSYLISEPCNRLTTQSNTQAAFAAKNSKTARRGIIIAALLTIPIAFMSTVIGLIAKVQFPDLENSSQAMATVMMSTPSLLAGIGMAGLWATEISTGSALLMASVQLVNNDFLVHLKKSSSQDPKKDAYVSRIVLVVLTVITLLVSYTITSMVGTIITILCITPAFFWVVLSLLFWPKLVKKHSAFITLLISLLFFVAWLFIPAIKTAFPTPIYVEWPLCTAIFWLCNIIEKEPISKLPERLPSEDIS